MLIPIKVELIEIEGFTFNQARQEGMGLCGQEICPSCHETLYLLLSDYDAALNTTVTTITTTCPTCHKEWAIVGKQHHTHDFT